MKKIFNVLVLAAIVISTAVSCKCSRDEEKVEPLDETAATEIVVENTISTDRQSMFVNHGDNYRWYETGVQLKNWLDEENDGSIDMVVNVFQVVIEESATTFDTFVYKIQHFATGESAEESVHGFWIEDYPMNDDQIKITFKEAFERVMAVNLPKPHSRQVVLRKMIGPKDCNPQWIFGNIETQIYVDAVTGEVSKDNPAFPAGFNYAFSW